MDITVLAMKKITFVLLAVLLLSCGGEKKNATAVAESWLKDNVLPVFENPKVESLSAKECKFDQTEVFNKQGTADNQRVALAINEVEKYNSGDRSDLAVNTKFMINTLVGSTVAAYQQLLKNRPDYTEVTANLSFDLRDSERGSFSYIVIMPTETLEVLNNAPQKD